MSVVCPDGHTSQSTDYCDTCGLPIGPQGAADAEAAVAADGTGGGASAAPASGAPSVTPPVTAPVAAPEGETCPNCGEVAAPLALFCEACGYDFTTGAMPPPPAEDSAVTGGESGGGAPPAPLTPPTTSSPDTAAGDGAGVAQWVAELWIDPDWYATQASPEPCPSPGAPVIVPLAEHSLLIGRRSVSRGITPQIDVGHDTGVSRRHAQLTTDGTRWWIEDLQSSNGTYVGAAGEPLPTDPLPAGRRTEFDDGDRIYLGAWTRLVVRRAAPGEV